MIQARQGASASSSCFEATGQCAKHFSNGLLNPFAREIAQLRGLRRALSAAFPIPGLGISEDELDHYAAEADARRSELGWPGEKICKIRCEPHDRLLGKFLVLPACAGCLSQMSVEFFQFYPCWKCGELFTTGRPLLPALLPGEFGYLRTPYPLRDPDRTLPRHQRRRSERLPRPRERFRVEFKSGHSVFVWDCPGRNRGRSGHTIRRRVDRFSSEIEAVHEKDGILRVRLT